MYYSFNRVHITCTGFAYHLYSMMEWAFSNYVWKSITNRFLGLGKNHGAYTNHRSTHGVLGPRHVFKKHPEVIILYIYLYICIYIL